MSFAAADALDHLRRAHAQDRLAHAYLITGADGAGKRELAAGLAALLLGCVAEALAHPDAHVIEPESKSRRISIDAVRELERELQMRSLRGGRKVGVIFDAERLTDNAANAFLKTLEEPPAQSHLLLLSTVPDQLKDTIVSRCIEIPLQAPGRKAPTQIEQSMLRALADFSRHEKPELPHIFLLVRQFQDLLGQVRSAIQEEHDAALKKEEPLYKQVGNKDGLDKREDFFKALTESRYVGERSRLLEIIEQWWADILRQNVCARGDCVPPALDHSEFAAQTGVMAARFTAAQLLRKAAALETLRDNFGRNVQEQLAIEVAFLNAFGAGS